MAELHLHGGRAVLDAVTRSLIELDLRPADPGEFTRRAVLFGKLTILEAEAVGDLVEAASDRQRQLALRQMVGEHNQVLESWSKCLTECLAWLEATIDFPEDEQSCEVDEDLTERLALLQSAIRKHLDWCIKGERQRRGLVFVITGPPNVGKSSLFNRLAGRDVAIVASSPGTTRDVLQAELTFAGISVTLVDTAGLRETTDTIESEGIRRANAQLALADFVIELTEPGVCLQAGEVENRICITNKTDLGPPSPGSLGISVLTDAGMSNLVSRLEDAALRLATPESERVFSRARHSAALRDMDKAMAAALGARTPELRAEELRSALLAIGRLTGRVELDSILDVVFREFCIGK